MKQGAIYCNDINKLKELVNKDNVNHSIGEDNWTVLYYACFWNRLEIVKYLLSIGADWNLKDCYNRTPLDVAIINKSIEVKEFLQFYIRFNK